MNTIDQPGTGYETLAPQNRADRQALLHIVRSEIRTVGKFPVYAYRLDGNGIVKVPGASCAFGLDNTVHDDGTLPGWADIELPQEAGEPVDLTEGFVRLPVRFHCTLSAATEIRVWFAVDASEYSEAQGNYLPHHPFLLLPKEAPAASP